MKTSILRLLTAVAVVLASGACNKKGDTFTVEGTIEGAKDSMLYLYNRSLNGPVLLDSVKLGDDGHYSFDVVAPQAPDFYLLRISNQLVNFSADSTETITINAQYPGMAMNYSVKGSDNSEMIRLIVMKQSALQRRIDALEDNLSLMGQPMVDSLKNMLREYKDDMVMNYIYKEPQKAYAYYALLQTVNHRWWAPHSIFDPNDAEDSKAYRAVATCWDTYYHNAERGQQLINQVTRDMTNQRIVAAREKQLLEQTEVVESGIIDLQLPDIEGRTRTLTELSGQVVLLDFHIFSDSQSAARILMLRELYNKYHSQGLEIYQVSIDQDDHLWRQSVENLPWVSVYDPAGFAVRHYNVQAVPEFFLIDRNNNLYKRSSQMTDIEAEIRSLL